MTFPLCYEWKRREKSSYINYLLFTRKKWTNRGKPLEKESQGLGKVRLTETLLEEVEGILKRLRKVTSNEGTITCFFASIPYPEPGCYSEQPEALVRNLSSLWVTNRTQ